MNITISFARYDDDKPLIFEPLPINDGWLIPEVLTPEESEHIRALAKSQTALAIAYENYKALYDHVHELNKNKCLFIPDFLTLPTPFGGFPIPNPTYIICQNLNFLQKVLAKIVVQVLKGRYVEPLVSSELFIVTINPHTNILPLPQ